MTLNSSRGRRVVAIVSLAASLAVAAAPIAEARAGRGSGGIGSRGSQTYAPPPATNTAPGTAGPIQRSQMQPGTTNPGMQAPGQRGRFGGGFMAGLLGAGLLGALVGGGFFGGLGGIASFLGLLLQVGLIVGLVYLAIRFFRRRQQPAMAGAGASQRSSLDLSGQAQGSSTVGGTMAGGLGGMMGGASSSVTRPQPITIQPADYEAFERNLNEIQTAYGREDVGTLRRYATPEMVGYFEEELRANAERGVVNRISEVKLLQGDLSQAWREGPLDYATVAMRFGLRDEMVELGSHRLVETGPSEATELWTFVRENGGEWRLSAIQQGR